MTTPTNEAAFPFEPTFSIETTDVIERRVRVEIPKEQMHGALEQTLRSLSNEVTVPGFRKGSAPIHVIKQRYGHFAKDKIVQSALEVSIRKVLDKLEERVAGVPTLHLSKEGENYSPSEPLIYHLDLEVFPEFTLQTNGIAITVAKNTVTKAVIAEYCRELLHSHTSWESAPERHIQKGDRISVLAVISAEQEKENGEPYRTTDTEHKGSLVIDELDTTIMPDPINETIKTMALGRRRGDQFTFTHTRKDAETQKDAHVTFAITIESVDAPKAPLTKETFWAHMLEKNPEECSTYTDTEDFAEKKLQERYENSYKSSLRNAVFAAFMDANPIPVPKTLIKEEIKSMQKTALKRLRDENSKTTATTPEAAGFHEALFHESADRRVRLGMLLNKLTQEQKITVDELRVTAMLQEIFGDSYEFAKNNTSVFNEISLSVLEDQLFEWLLERTNVTITTNGSASHDAK